MKLFRSRVNFYARHDEFIERTITDTEPRLRVVLSKRGHSIIFGFESQDQRLELAGCFKRFSRKICTNPCRKFDTDRKVSKMLDFVRFLGVLGRRSLAVNTNIL